MYGDQQTMSTKGVTERGDSVNEESSEREVMAGVRKVRKLIALSLSVVEQASRLFDQLSETENASTAFSPDVLSAGVRLLTNLLSRCKQSSVRLDHLLTIEKLNSSEESLNLLVEKEHEMGSVAPQLLAVVGLLQWCAERCHNQVTGEQAGELNLHMLSMN